MPPNRPQREESGHAACSREQCGRAAAFRVYRRPTGRWHPLCGEHTRSLHPSLEIKAWLESGYAKPVELDTPSGAPSIPATGRHTAFREMVDRAMGWDASPAEE